MLDNILIDIHIFKIRCFPLLCTKICMFVFYSQLIVFKRHRDLNPCCCGRKNCYPPHRLRQRPSLPVRMYFSRFPSPVTRGESVRVQSESNELFSISGGNQGFTPGKNALQYAILNPIYFLLTSFKICKLKSKHNVGTYLS